MATPQFSVYTPQGLGTVPPASFAQNFVPAFAQGLLQVAKTYQARKSVEQAADEASALFNDPAYGNIFRQMGLAAISEGQSPVPIINSMLSTAINLRKDEDQMAQRERMMRMQFGQQTALENLRTSNNLREFDARKQYEAEQNSPNALYNRELGQMAARAGAAKTFSESPLGQETIASQNIARNQKLAEEVEMEKQKTRARREAMNEIPLNIGGGGDVNATEYLLNAGVDLETSPTQMEPADIQDQIEIISSITDPTIARAAAGRLRLFRDELNLRQDSSALRKRDKALQAPAATKKPSDSATSRYLEL